MGDGIMKNKALVLTVALILPAAGLVAQVMTTSFQEAGSFAAPGSLPSFGQVWQDHLIAGRPFSATVVTHTVQTFANGTKADHTETGLFYRDAQGRTRRETHGTAFSGENYLVAWIMDPVAGVRITFNAPQAPNPGARGGGQPRYSMETLSPAVLANETAAPPASPYQAALERMGRRGKKGASGRGGSAVPVPTLADLGTQTVNGVTAQGVRVTSIIPAGAIGNDREIPVVSEGWVSTELQVLVKSTYSDPRFGTTTYELTNISQRAPDSALFQVPAGYEMRQSKGARGGGQGGTDTSVRTYTPMKK
jgi:hypothetical protein